MEVKKIYIIFSETLFLILNFFTEAILGAMLIYAAFLLGEISFKDYNIKTILIIIISAIFCFIYNITFGFIIGLVLYLILDLIKKKFDDY